jgi:hypothetical protein
VLAEVFAGYPHGRRQSHPRPEIDAFVEGGTSRRRPPGANSFFPPAIAAYVNELIDDGDTIQVGTGRATGQLAVAGAFDGKEDLGVHSEIRCPA